uniref:Uncharacterized protein n=1 Tax=Tetraodon nigroviridis TaxID=99883 RepID=H3DQS4_TETNG
KPGKQESTEEEELVKHLDPLHQLIHLFSRTALTEKCKLDEDNLYMAYADIMAKSCHDEEDEDGEVKSFEVGHPLRLCNNVLLLQARLHNRGAAEMVLQTISASKGRIYPKFHRNTYILVIFKSNSIGKQILYYSEEFAEQKSLIF